MTTTFENVQAGHRVWDIIRGHGTTEGRCCYGCYNFLKVLFDSGVSGYYFDDGKMREGGLPGARTLFWQEVTIIAPPKPLPKLAVDTKVLVWNEGSQQRYKSHFAAWSDEGHMLCWHAGKTSFTGADFGALTWDFYQLAEGGE